MMLRRTVEIGKYTCEMALREDGNLFLDWSPEVPTRLNKLELALYRQERNALIGLFAERAGLNVMLVEA